VGIIPLFVLSAVALSAVFLKSGPMAGSLSCVASSLYAMIWPPVGWVFVLLFASHCAVSGLFKYFVFKKLSKAEEKKVFGHGQLSSETEAENRKVENQKVEEIQKAEEIQKEEIQKVENQKEESRTAFDVKAEAVKEKTVEAEAYDPYFSISEEVPRTVVSEASPANGARTEKRGLRFKLPRFKFPKGRELVFYIIRAVAVLIVFNVCLYILTSITEEIFLLDNFLTGNIQSYGVLALVCSLVFMVYDILLLGSEKQLEKILRIKLK
jgi:hypothetical protein